MINNRQNGRRRGRGGAPRQNGGNGQGGNRIDNRARGNAAQLHEKYKTLARDAQTQGDRVMTEYYLQFADHYFRVLSENRPRFEEQQRRDRFDNADFEDEEGENEAVAGGEREERGGNEGGERNYRERREPRPREERSFREDRAPREERMAREDRRPREDRAPRDEAEQGEDAVAAAPEAAEAPRRRGRPRRTEAAAPAETAERIDMDRLPPSLSLASESAEAPADAEEKPKRRPRRPRAEAAGAEA
ncbi:DUF4167 domain-containing protein [Edaphosphingomonas haloaromaticamans]|uniref:DUF4167 domain-containing protein n=1 Tax=Edaphosphingomonas haloaromaticamans TaxID=653954 RepID=A0A1S1H7U2_9SPHN|nr:DUF4167 domain-containing protein [Sphingomonas haloaromaticamans]OHT18167.1 hypothetical protein BHE75_00136 [Sphingomonas haloaromaticamans]